MMNGRGRGRGLVKQSSFYMAPELFKRQGEQPTDTICGRFSGNNKEVKRYKFEPEKIKLSYLNPHNGQSNSLYFGVKKYFAFYSQSQHKARKSIQWREFYARLNEWKNIYTSCHNACRRRACSKAVTEIRLHKILKYRPCYDNDNYIYEFKNRWGKNIEITDVFDTSIYPNLDVLISMIKREWPDAQFAGIVVKFNKKGDIVNN